MGESSLSAGDLPTALYYFSVCVLVDPENYIHLKQRASVLLALGEYERALQDTQRVVAAKPTWAKVCIVFCVVVFICAAFVEFHGVLLFNYTLAIGL